MNSRSCSFYWLDAIMDSTHYLPVVDPSIMVNDYLSPNLLIIRNYNVLIRDRKGLDEFKFPKDTTNGLISFDFPSGNIRHLHLYKIMSEKKIQAITYNDV